MIRKNNIFFLTVTVIFFVQTLKPCQSSDNFYARLQAIQGSSLQNAAVADFLGKSHDYDKHRLDMIYADRDNQEREALTEQALHYLQTLYPTNISDAGAQLDLLMLQRRQYFEQLIRQEFRP